MEQESNLVKPMSPNVKMATKAHFAGFDSLMYGTCFFCYTWRTRWPMAILSTML